MFFSILGMDFEEFVSSKPVDPLETSGFEFIVTWLVEWNVGPTRGVHYPRVLGT